MPSLHELIKNGSDVAGICQLLREGENPNIESEYGNTALHYCAFKSLINPQELQDNLEVARILIHYGANVDAKNSLGQTPLHLAVSRRNYKLIEIFMESKADIGLKDNDGDSSLHYAVNNCKLLSLYVSNFNCRCETSHSDIDTVKLLLKFSPDIDIVNARCETPLIWAVKQNDLLTVKILLDHGASPYTRDMYGKHALHYALESPKVKVKIVIALLRHGADHTLRTVPNISPLESYLFRLYDASTTELQKAKLLMKMFVFKDNMFGKRIAKQIKNISKKNKIRLYEFFWYCRYEVEKMKVDEVSSDLSMYDLASRGFNLPPETRLPTSEVFLKALEKLKKGEYCVYSDLIVSGIDKQYLTETFSEMSAFVNDEGQAREFLNCNLRHDICKYFSNFELLNLIKAFSPNSSLLRVCRICRIPYVKF